MRLLDTTSLRLEEFWDPIPEYAILSHTWSRKEVSYPEWVYAHSQIPSRYPMWNHQPESIDELKSREGYRKIIEACRQARQDSYNWIWIDTICIDKTSSAELSEAINSMYQWYSDSEICYVYLSDVPGLSYEDCLAQDSLFCKSRWFKRGWTLQELLAPSKTLFYSKDWQYLSDKISLIERIHTTTRIPRAVITTKNNIVLFSIADRMNWSSSRTTTRIEDMAYCLLGIFGVNMPLLYGEGKKAFLRLQEEITRRSTDQSFLIWRPASENKSDSCRSSSLLAPGPACFCEGEIENWKRAEDPFSFNNMGLSIRLPVVETSLRNFVFAILDSRPKGKFFQAPDSSSPRPAMAYWIPLIKYGENRYERVIFPANYVQVAQLSQRRSIFDLWVSSDTEPIDIIIGPGQGVFSSDLSRHLRDRLPKLQQLISPMPQAGVLLAFPSTLCGWKFSSVFPDYGEVFRSIFRYHPHNNDNGIIWLKQWDGDRDVYYCTVEFTHYSKNAPAIQFIIASHYTDNEQWEPYARCFSTGSRRTTLRHFSENALETLQDWSHECMDDLAYVQTNGPWSDFTEFSSEVLCKTRIFVAQLCFKDLLKEA